ncbi:hypothetical protein W97_01982 [Coniosporium apollinis CBS 100218]|uniref:Cytochrome P450 monooxygenase ABA1 n=1 Tax=Coniosporium apollinis (strain CBS 100218) TaxID=1168221 RepID=R7YLF5_CONA1|nr:uncharacterized protein W97_01982 [Coniosporium apollinis CBS 100218]EON62757.1 hypothetical protein W97_01982 [Coniosporium apollinis CBS 100218]
MAISIVLLASIVAALAVLFYVVSSIQSYRRLSHIPGPPLAAFSILWQIRALNSGQNNLKVEEVNQKYGPLARIGPNSLVTSDPDLLRRMSAARSPYRRGSWYNAMRMKPRKDNILSVRDEKHHDELRRKMAFGYAGKENPLLEETIDKHIHECVDLIERKYVSSGTDLKKMDFGRVAQFLTLDIISGLAFDRPFGDIAHDQDMFEYIKTTEENLPVMILMTILPWVHKLLEKSYLMDFLAPSVKDKVGLGKIINIAQERVAERFLPDGKKRDQQDMLGSFIRHGLTREEAESESVLQILAGSDTTATGIRTTMLFLITNPSVLAKLRSEIDSAMRDNRISSPITDAEARNLPYLQAFIKEGLRIWPPITGLMEKVVPPEGDVVNGMFVPGGTQIGYCAWGVHRNTRIFGHDADVFRPDRWLEAQGEQLQSMERNNDLIFGHGRFTCLGKTVAFMELNKVFVELLRRFDFTIIDPSNPWKVTNVGMWMQSNMWVRVTRREDAVR